MVPMLSLLAQKIETICPFDTLRVGKEDDRSTWEIIPSANATPEQIATARAVIANFDVEAERLAAISVTPWQAREALRRAGLLADVEVTVEGLGVTSEAYIAWHYAERIRRSSPLIAALAPALNLSDAQLDALFDTARGLHL